MAEGLAAAGDPAGVGADGHELPGGHGPQVAAVPEGAAKAAAGPVEVGDAHFAQNFKGF